MTSPPGTVVRVRPRAWCDVVAALAVVGYVVGDFAVLALVGERQNHETAWLAWQFVPWLLGLPFLRRVSMSPSAWLVLSLLCPMNFLLLGRLTYRLMSLPARDWAPAYWELDRAVPFPDNPRFWLLGPAPATPLRERLGPPPGSPLRFRLMWTSRLAWVVVVPAAIVAFALRNSEVSSWWDMLLTPLLGGLVLVPIAPELAWRAVRATRPAPEPAPAPA